MPGWLMPLIKASIAVCDLLIAFGCFTFAFLCYEGKPLFSSGSFGWSPEFAPYGALLWFILPIRILTIKANGLYRLRGEFSFFDDTLKALKAASIGTLLIVAAAFLYRGGFEFTAFSYSRAVFFLDFILALACFSIFRAAIRGGQILARKQGINLIPTIIVGTGREAKLCIEEIAGRKELGYRVVGVVTTSGFPAGSFEGVEIVGEIADLPEIVPLTAANEVIITDAEIAGELLFDVMMRCGRRKGIEFRITPNLFDSLPRKTAPGQIGNLPMIHLFREPLSPAQRLLKRIEDVSIAGFLLLILLPLCGLIAILVKAGSKGSILYKQKRVGMDGRQFSFYKFRTMKEGNDPAEHREFLKSYIAGKAESQAEDAKGPVFKLQEDPRVTPIGKYLRRYSLDELPQLFNVLRGEMSIVGPRPPIPYEVEAYNASQRRRLDMKPGITGMWQVSGRNRLTFDEMLRLDIFYIENWSLWLDLRIIFLTPLAMLRGDGAK